MVITSDLYAFIKKFEYLGCIGLVVFSYICDLVKQGYNICTIFSFVQAHWTHLIYTIELISTRV